MMGSYLEQTLAKIEEFEGAIPWMYVDSVGKVTVGMGMVLPDCAAAIHLPFQVGARAATKDEIAADFARVDALPMGRPALFYRRAGAPELEIPVIYALLRTVLVGLEEELREKVAGYEGLPNRVKIALLDMAHNLGPVGLLNGCSRMIGAVEKEEWAQAAAASFRHGSGAARNQWTSAMLRGELTRETKVRRDGALKRFAFGMVGLGATLIGRFKKRRQR